MVKGENQGIVVLLKLVSLQDQEPQPFPNEHIGNDATVDPYSRLPSVDQSG